MTDYDWRDENWNKLSFIYDGDDGNGDVESEYRGKLYNVLDEILHRLKKLEDKSHMHKFQLPLSHILLALAMAIAIAMVMAMAIAIAMVMALALVQFQQQLEEGRMTVPL